MNICLISPPVIDPSMPWLAIYQLKAYINKVLPEHSIDAFDLNINFFNSIVENPYKNFTDVNLIESYKQIIKNENLITSKLKEWSLVNKIELTRQSLGFSFNVSDSCELSNYLEKTSPFSEYLQEFLLSSVEVKSYDLICFTITCYEQLICTLLLAKAIKKVQNSVQIAIGGNVISRIDENIFSIRNFSDYIDFIIKKEGELPLENLILYLENKTIRKSTNCLIKSSNNKIIDFTNTPVFIDLNTIAITTFKEIDTSLYYSPSLVFPISFSRGCSWGRCTFCGIHSNWCSKYNVRPVKKIVDEIETITKLHRIYLFRIVDESPALKDIIELSNEIIDRGLDIKLEAYANINKKMVKEKIGKVLYKAGFRQFFFGLESYDKDILYSVKKEINAPEFYTPILTNLNKYGISNYGFFMIGLPNDKLENEFKLEEFILSTMSLNTIAVSSFLPVTNSEMVNDNDFSKKYGIEYFLRGDLTTRCKYTINGVSVEDNVNSRVEDMLKRIFMKRRDLYISSNIPYEARFYLITKYGNNFSKLIADTVPDDNQSIIISNELIGRAKGLITRNNDK